MRPLIEAVEDKSLNIEIKVSELVEDVKNGKNYFKSYKILNDTDKDFFIWDEFVSRGITYSKNNNITFFNCEFTDSVNFTTFREGENSYNAKFYFDECTFHSDFTTHTNFASLDFTYCEFMNFIQIFPSNVQDFKIRYCKFHDTLRYDNDNSINCKIKIQDCEFRKEVYFDLLNLSDQFRVYNSDLTNFSFLKTNFLESKFEGCWFDFNSLIIENDLSKKIGEDSRYISNVIEMFRKFEIIFDNQKNYEYAGEFHKHRFELARKFSSKKSLKFWLLSLYKYFSKYGESYVRALIWFLIFFVSFTIVYLFSGLNFTDHNGPVTIFYLKPENQFNFLNDFCLAAIYSLNNVIPFKKDLTYITAANGWTTLFTILESFILTILASLFVIGLRRKFKR